MSFFEHLGELRKRILWSIFYILIFFLAAWPFVDKVYQWLAQPVIQFLPEGETLAFTSLTEPFMMCGDRSNEMLRDLRNYIEAVGRMAEQFDAVPVPLQSAIDEQIKAVSSDKWSDDMVHPYTWAHAWISQQWIEATKL